jgi:crotonobetainyl-CoA:carnitine CoA-transferase CaiB-like acyl-CoA transferase
LKNLWQRQLNDARIPCAKYATLAEAITDPQLQHRDMIVEIEDAAGPLKVVNTPFLFSHTQATVRPWVARPGEQTHDVLEDVLNYTPDQIAALDAQGVFGKTSQDNS